MKVLAVCQAGTVRSGALALAAKRHGGHDALAAGIDYNAPETLDMLARWADKILVAEQRFAAYLPLDQAHKVVDAALGPDRWHNPLHPELEPLCDAVVAAL